MELLEGVFISPTCTLSDYWKDASRIWVDTVRNICVNFGYEDASWEYLERTNSAILAGCLTCAGAPAMPETYVMRNGKESKQSERVDICIVTCNLGITTLELVECKLAEYDASKPRKPTTVLEILSKLDAATTQVNGITGIHGVQLANPIITVKRTSVVIGLPKFPSETTIALRAEAIQKIISHLRLNSAVDVVAWCFPEQYLEHRSRRYEKDYPGTFLAVKNVPSPI